MCVNQFFVFFLNDDSGAKYDEPLLVAISRGALYGDGATYLTADSTALPDILRPSSESLSEI